MDKISIKGLEVYAYHGVREKEKREGQKFFVDAELFSDLRKAGMSDDLADTINYSRVCSFIHDYVSCTRFDLIEALAEHLAEELLMNYGKLEQVRLTVHKPDAPLKLPFGDLSVDITRTWRPALLGIGSNMGDRLSYINQALCKLKSTPRIRGARCSELQETKPYGGVEQDDFLNGAVYIKTILPPYELLDFLHEIENEAGRERTIHWGPRTLDLDILFYGDLVLDDPQLTIPHPDMQNREFILKPLCEITPHYVNPLNGKTVSDMYEDLKRR